MAGGGGASPYVLPERVALDARASLARRVGASAVLLLIDRFIASPMWIWMIFRCSPPATHHLLHPISWEIEGMMDADPYLTLHPQTQGFVPLAPLEGHCLTSYVV